MDGIFYAKLEDDREESGDEQASTDKTEERGGREEVESGSKLNLTVEQEADKSDQDFNYLTSGNTMPVSDSESDGEAPTDIVEEMNRNSLSLRSSDSSSVRSSLGDNRNELSLYQQQFMAPTMNYDRENTSQKLIAVVGREFDRPTEIAVELQRLVPKQLFSESMQAKFIPFTIKRKFLMKGNFESHELQKHDLICMCYNASEARLLLTGTDGFYSALLRQTEVFLGSNKVTFLVFNYNPPAGSDYSSSSQDGEGEPPLILSSLKTRLYHQRPLRPYLENQQILSWRDHPSKAQVNHLIELSKCKQNPSNSCCIL